MTMRLVSLVLYFLGALLPYGTMLDGTGKVVLCHATPESRLLIQLLSEPAPQTHEHHAHHHHHSHTPEVSDNSHQLSADCIYAFAAGLEALQAGSPAIIRTRCFSDADTPVLAQHPYDDTYPSFQPRAPPSFLV